MNAIWLIIALVIISSVIGAVAKLLNNLQETSNARRIERERYERAERERRRRAEREDERAERPKPDRPDRPPERADRPPPTAEPAGVKPAASDMDRFLAEIDKLRRKASLAPDAPSAVPGTSPPVAPVVQPIKPPPEKEKPRPRVVAELADSAAAASSAAGFNTGSHAPARSAPVAGQVEELPVAQVLRPSSSTGAPATKVTRFANRPRPAAKTNFGKNLTALLGSGQGVAMAVVLQEILGPPKSRRRNQ